jgi:hypothetical protein
MKSDVIDKPKIQDSPILEDLMQEKLSDNLIE